MGGGVGRGLVGLDLELQYETTQQRPIPQLGSVEVTENLSQEVCAAKPLSFGSSGPTAVGGVPAHPGEGMRVTLTGERRAVTCDYSAHGPFLRARARPCVYMR